jgi:4-hydroxy-2-oxoheptanedioate aldolase
MRPSVIKAKLSQSKPALLTQLHFTDPSVYELASLMGFDGIWMDMEHHAYSLETAASLMRAARVGTADIMARAAKGELARVARLLEAGAQGIMYPRCDNAAEAAEVVKWAKFAPIGKRGFDGGNPDMPYCMMSMAEYIKEANEQTFIVIQIEEREALEHAEAIAAVPGVDVVFLGPADFSVLSGIPGEFNHPSVQKAVERVAKAARNAGKHWGMPAFSSEHCQVLLEMGARLICHSADIILFKHGLDAIQEQFKKLGFTFNRACNNNGQAYLKGL